MYLTILDVSVYKKHRFVSAAISSCLAAFMFFSPITIIFVNAQANDIPVPEISDKTPALEGSVIVKYKEEKIDLDNLSGVEALDLYVSEIGIDETKAEIEEINVKAYEDNLDTDELLEKFSEKPSVEYVEPNYIFNIFEDPSYDTGELPDLNDTYFDDQWALDNDQQTGGISGFDSQFKEYLETYKQSLSATGGTVEVAVLDTGVDYTHPDLQDQIRINEAEFPDAQFPFLDANSDGKITFAEFTGYAISPLDDFNNDGNVDLSDLIATNINPSILYQNPFLDGIDNDNNGYTDDFFGWDFVGQDNDPFDFNSHGTHVAGIIGAEYENSLGIAGAGLDVEIAPIKIFGDDGFATLSGILEGVAYITNNNINVSNNSWGFTIEQEFAPSSLYDAIELYGQQGGVFVVASGNGKYFAGHSEYDPNGYNMDISDVAAYPGFYDLDNIINVAAINSSAQMASFSNYGPNSVDISAQGISIYSTVIGNYSYKSGTSMAAPMVAAAVAGIRKYEPAATASSIRQTIIDNTPSMATLAGLTVADSLSQDGKYLDYESLTPIEVRTTDNSGVVSATAGFDVQFDTNKLVNISGTGDYLRSQTQTFNLNGDHEVSVSDKYGATVLVGVNIDQILKVHIANLEDGDSVGEGTNTVISGGCFSNYPVTATATDSGSSMQVNGITCENGMWNSEIDLSWVSEGIFTLDIEQNSGPEIVESDQISLNKDLTAPVLDNINIAEGESYTFVNSFEIIGAIEGTEATNVALSVNGSSKTVVLDSLNNTFSSTLNPPTAGVNSIEITLTDEALNESVYNYSIVLIDGAQSSTSSSGRSSSGGGGGGGSSSSAAATPIFVSEDLYPFIDIDVSVFREYISELHDMGIVSGFTDGTFKPDNSVTRAEFSKMLVNALGLSFDSGAEIEEFSDVGTDSVFYEFIYALKQNSITDGFSDNSFRPDQPITRNEAVKLIYRALAIQNKISVDSGLKEFPDVPVTDSFYVFVSRVGNIQVEGTNIVGGYSDGEFKGQEEITRGQTAKIVLLSNNYSNLV